MKYRHFSKVISPAGRPSLRPGHVLAFKPHDLHLPYITACAQAQALATGTPLASVQAVDAREARKTFNLRYG